MSVLDKLNIYTLEGHAVMSLNNVFGDSNVSLDDYDISDFLVVCPEFKNVFDGNENNRYNIMFSIWLDQAKKVITEEYGDNMFICYTWYIAHHLAITLNQNKNIGNSANLTSVNVTNNLAYNQGGKDKKTSAKSEFEADYGRTEYGRNLLEIMRIVAKGRLYGGY